MDWYSWLSSSGLDTLLVHEYNRTFTRNELQREDIAHFNHEFLLSMGISIAKHRLEILKLAKKEVGVSPRSFSGLVKRLFTTKKLRKSGFHKNATPMSPYRDLHKYMVTSRSTMRPELLESNEEEKNNISHGRLSPCRAQWNRESYKHMVERRSTMRSGPLDMRRQEKCVVPSRSLSLSGPLEGKTDKNFMVTNWSTSPAISRQPTIDTRLKGRLVISNCGSSLSGPLDRVGLSPKLKNHSDNLNLKEEVQSLWSLMFQDMRPT